MAFKRCRRSWDFGARVRENYEPVPDRAKLDLDRAIRDALAVYYFPGMWQWSREIVQPLALQGFDRSVQRQRAGCQEAQFTSEERVAWEEQVELGQQMLKRYFEWAPALDHFVPMRVETEFQVNIPDPVNSGCDLVTQGGPVQFQGRIDLLLVDQNNKHWLLQHRIAPNWSGLGTLFFEDQGLAFCWAWEAFFLGMRLEGLIYNEMRLQLATDQPGAPSGPNVDRMFELECNQWFRRVLIPRARHEIETVGVQLAMEALDMISPELRIYPNPSDENCARCLFQAPCLALTEGANPNIILEQSFQKKGLILDQGRLGGSNWSVGRGSAPPRSAQEHTHK